jgi:hypothetical protein
MSHAVENATTILPWIVMNGMLLLDIGCINNRRVRLESVIIA